MAMSKEEAKVRAKALAKERKLRADELDRLYRKADSDDREFDRPQRSSPKQSRNSLEKSLGHSLYLLAQEILRLRFGCWQLERGLADLDAGKSFFAMSHSRYVQMKHLKYDGGHKEYRASGFYDELAKLMVKP